MNIFLAIALLGNLGSDSLRVDPEATIISYRQSPTNLTTEGTDLIGGTLGGYFNNTQNYEHIASLGLLATLTGTNPNSFFTIELYSGDSLELVGVYLGNTQDLTPTGETNPITLDLIETGGGNMSDIRGFQFTWLGEGNPIEFTMQNLVDVNPPTPQIISYGFEPLGFTIRWTGTGNRPVNVQRTTDLKNGTWITIASNITTQTYSDPSTPNNRAFYKVVIP